MTTKCEPNNFVIICPLCEERSTQCTCRIDFGDDKSCTLQSDPNTQICNMCGYEISNCLCDFPSHDINLNTGVCVRCLLVDPGNQICSAAKTCGVNLTTSTPKLPGEKSGARRRLFGGVQYHYESIISHVDT